MISRVGLTVLTLGLLGCIERPIREADLPLFVTIEDMRPLGLELGPMADRQEFRRNQFLDGALELEYEFQTPEEADRSIYLATTVGFERSVTDARIAFRVSKGGAGVGARVGGATIREDPQFFSWGDESFFAYIDGERGPGGNIFGARTGRKTYWVMVAGVYFNDRRKWAEFIGPKLAYLSQYEPAR